MQTSKRKSEVFNLQNIYQAYLDCRRNKRNTTNALKFESNAEENLFALEEELKNKTYKPGRSICFAVNDPSLREIFAADFRDRIVHHLLVSQVEEFGERRFISDSFACRVNKGMHKAVERLQNFYRKASDNYRYKVYYAQLDISGFFMSIDHYILYEIFTRLVEKQKKPRKWKEEMLWLGGVIIFHKPTENYIIKGNRRILNNIPPRKSLFSTPVHKGLPIGNYSSQFFGNLYLNELDQFVKRELKCKYYLRYVDDFIILNKDRKKLYKLSREIKQFLRDKLNLQINPVKTKIRPLEQGIDFLGYVVKKDYTLVRKRVVRKLKKKTANIRADNLPLNFTQKESPLEQINTEISSLNSYYGHLKHANAYGLKKHIFKNYLMNNRPDFRPEEGFRTLKVKKDYLKVYRGRSLFKI